MERGLTEKMDVSRKRRDQLWQKRMRLETIRREGHHRRRGLSLKERFMDAATWLFAAGLYITGLYWVGVRNARRFVLKRLELSFDGLPAAFDGLRVLHLTDLHFGGNRAFLETLCAFLDPVDCDVCLITGDYRYGRLGEEPEIQEGIKRLVPCLHARHGVAAVLGNHDDGVFAEWFRAEGVRMLINEHWVLETGSDRIVIAGVDDPHMYRSADVALAMEGAPADAFTVLMAHSPEAIEAASANGVAFYLCGHTHAGQVRIPGLGAILSNTRASRAYAQGLWRHDKMFGYTSAGLGTTELPVRFFCPPEATLFTLRQANR